MSPHYLVKCKTFTSDWRQCWRLWKSRLWVGIGGSDR